MFWLENSKKKKKEKNGNITLIFQEENYIDFFNFS
jgi:hypothetical protein